MRATALTEPGPVDGPLSATAATPAGRSTATGDPHTNWTERRGPVSTHSFDPMASVDAIVNFGRGASFGLSDRIANWIVPGASCTVPQDSLDQFLGSAATTLLGGEALGALLRSGRLGELLARIRGVDWADETGSLGGDGLSPNQMDRAIQRGQAPRGFKRVDPPRIPGEQYNIHFDDGSALNMDGTWKHGGRVLTRAQAEWLAENGWVVP